MCSRSPRRDRRRVDLPPGSRKPGTATRPERNPGARPTAGSGRQHERGGADLGGRRRREPGIRTVEQPAVEAGVRTLVRDAQSLKTRAREGACKIPALPRYASVGMPRLPPVRRGHRKPQRPAECLAGFRATPVPSAVIKCFVTLLLVLRTGSVMLPDPSRPQRQPSHVPETVALRQIQRRVGSAARLSLSIDARTTSRGGA